MDAILKMCQNEYFGVIILGINIIMIIIFVMSIVMLNKSKKMYKELIKKLSKSNNIEEMLQNYMEKVQIVDEQNKKIKLHCDNLDKEISKCIKKVGIVRYSAFKDMGSDLSFTLALLDEKNDGVVLNGIYSVENSNIYAKPIENGKSKYTISEEEKRAIDIAMQ